MGSLDQARAATAAFRQATEQNMQLLQGANQRVNDAQQALQSQLGTTSHPKVQEVNARSQEARQKLGEALQALAAARQAVDQFAAGLA